MRIVVCKMSDLENASIKKYKARKVCVEDKVDLCLNKISKQYKQPSIVE